MNNPAPNLHISAPLFQEQCQTVFRVMEWFSLFYSKQYVIKQPHPVLVKLLVCALSEMIKVKVNVVTRSVDYSGYRKNRQSSNNFCYYSFKIFPQFWLAKSTRLIIHHNYLLVTKFRRILCLTRRWRQKCRKLRHP